MKVKISLAVHSFLYTVETHWVRCGREKKRERERKKESLLVCPVKMQHSVNTRLKFTVTCLDAFVVAVCDVPQLVPEQREVSLA